MSVPSTHQEGVAKTRCPLPHCLVGLVQHVRLQHLRLAQTPKAKSLGELYLGEGEVIDLRRLAT